MLLFDDTLPALAECIAAELGPEVLSQGVVLRDASGRLAFFAAREIPADILVSVRGKVEDLLGSYARQDRVVVDSAAPGAAGILADPTAQTMEVAGHAVRYVDRRVVGADWLEGPDQPVAAPPRFVFASLKGGVGRSTAISVLAADRARMGHNVLVVDMDLEAPGVGAMLLDRERSPQLGSLDYLVESSLRDLDAPELDDFVGTSGLTAGSGLVDVVPVAGTRTGDHPLNYMSKLARAMTEQIRSDGESLSLRRRLRLMVDRFAGRRPYDLILIDARAGMAELAAGPVLGLGAATVFLFATAQQQSVEGYRYLFAHLSTLVVGSVSPWRQLQMVHAKATLNDESHRWLSDQFWDLFSEYLYEEVEGLEGFNYAADDPEAPHSPIPIPLDTLFVDWDPVSKPSALTAGHYEASFGPLLGAVTAGMGS